MADVVRIVGILLALCLGTPAIAWGGMLVPAGVERVGTVCCGMQDRDDQQEPKEGQELQRTCCCKPSPIAPGVDTVYRAPLSETKIAVIAPALVSDRFDRPRARQTALSTTHHAARAPPLVRPLLQQRTSFQI